MDNVVMDLTNAKIAEIKSRTMDKFFLENRDDGLKIYRADIDKYDYCEIAEIDCKTVQRLGSFYGLLEYFENGGQFTLNCETYVNDELSAGLSCKYSSPYDFLDLFSKEEKADNSLENFFNDNLENVVRKLKETYPDVVESIEQNVISNIRNYDPDDSDKEYFAESYIEDNPVESVEKAACYLCDDDKKRFICDWVDNL